MEIDELVRAVQTLNAEDAFRARLTLENWRVIAPIWRATRSVPATC
jgi:hypothetical protein